MTEQNKFTIVKNCPFCNKPHSVELENADDFSKYIIDHFTQFPYLDSSQREILISGICPECWDKVFAPEDD